MNEDLEFCVSARMPGELRLVLWPRRGTTITSITGTACGPFCEFSKTLTADFRFQKVSRAGVEAGAVEVLVLDPCYWTPELPFLYEFHLSLKMVDGTERSVLATTGVVRLHCEADNLRMNLKRVVLRGTRCSAPTKAILQQAREHETALIVDYPEAWVCELASRIGVPLVVDLREIDRPWQEVGRELDWFPAVILVLLSTEQLVDVDRGWLGPRHSFVALAVSADASAEQIANLQYDLLAVELSGNGRPLEWIAGSEKPVIAIRRGESYPGLAGARSSCDRLQADLAPQFNLAGYFVSP